MSGISKTDLLNGLIKNTFVVGQLQPIAALLATVLTTGGKEFTPCFLQRVLNGNDITPVVMTVTSSRVTVIPYSQRRRTTRQFGSAPG
jgi:hypothetical protein